MPESVPIRADVVWPPLLIRPPRPPAVVYIDLNHFINLAKVAIGKTAPAGYAELLAAARDAVRTGRAIFPLSVTHLLEVSDISQARQRADVANVMAELSKFHYLLGRALIMEFEIEASVGLLLGRDVTTVGPADLIGYGGFWPFGERMRAKIVNAKGQDTTEQCRAEMGADEFDATMARANWDAQMLLLNGGDSGHPQGTWRPDMESRAQREIDQVAAIDTDPAYRGVRLRDVVNAVEMYGEMNRLVAACLDRNGVWLNDLFPVADGKPVDVQAARDFTDGMPSTRVSVSLKAHYHRNREHDWKTNDIHDIDALAGAVPYCDAVFADKAMRNGLLASPELALFGTVLPRTPIELADWLNQLPAP